jgi:hypothetical protein
MKTVLAIIFLLWTSIILPQESNLVYQERGSNVTRTCIVCGQEWTEWVKGDNISLWGGTTTLSVFDGVFREERGIKWSVYLHDNAYLCNHCNSLYGGGWQEILKTKFNQLLQQAIEEQKDYAAKVRTNLKIKKLKELQEKLNGLQKEIDEAKK